MKKASTNNVFHWGPCHYFICLLYPYLQQARISFFNSHRHIFLFDSCLVHLFSQLRLPSSFAIQFPPLLLLWLVFLLQSKEQIVVFSLIFQDTFEISTCLRFMICQISLLKNQIIWFKPPLLSFSTFPAM